jgi:hypothetical protein
MLGNNDPFGAAVNVKIGTTNAKPGYTGLRLVDLNLRLGEK